MNFSVSRRTAGSPVRESARDGHIYHHAEKCVSAGHANRLAGFLIGRRRATDQQNQNIDLPSFTPVINLPLTSPQQQQTWRLNLQSALNGVKHCCDDELLEREYPTFPRENDPSYKEREPFLRPENCAMAFCDYLTAWIFDDCGRMPGQWNSKCVGNYTT
ncbi:hypothetical protein RU639_001588 [Aspergillus parasiticus]